MWSTWADERAKHVASQRSAYLKRHTAALASSNVSTGTSVEEGDECAHHTHAHALSGLALTRGCALDSRRRAFARQCVLSLQEGARATLTIQQATGINVQLVLSMGFDVFHQYDGVLMVVYPSFDCYVDTVKLCMRAGHV